MLNISNPRSEKITFIIIDLCIIFTSYIFAFILRSDSIQERNWESFISLSPWIMLISLFFISVYELYSVSRKNKLDIIRNVLVAVTLMIILTMAASFLFREFALPRSVIILSFLIGGTSLILWKLLYLKLAMHHPKSVLYVGGGQEQRKFTNQMEKYFGKKTKMYSISNESSLKEVLDSLSQVDFVLIGSKVTPELKSNVIYQAVKKGKVVYVIPELQDLLLSQSITSSIDDTMIMTVKPFGLSWDQQIFKRLYDIAISLIALFVTAPLMGIVSIVIKMESPKSGVIYKQKRLGRYNKEFTIYKFRSMVEGAENKTGPVLAGEWDARITPIGKFLRKSRIDELPQFFNVLKGDMSIVGPRPERDFFTKQFEKEYDSYNYRNTVKPGITGYAQIKGKYTTSVEDKLRFDLFYIRSYSFFLDMIIQLKTIVVILDQTKAKGESSKKDINRKEGRPVNQ